MKEKLRNKKVVYTIIGIVSVLLVMLAVTYAYWLVTKTQTGENEISSACLDIAISGEKNDITLTNEFPMSDEDGMKLVPYEFTVTNNCNTSVDYQVALEATGDSSNALKGTSLKVALNDSAKLYSAYPSVETTIEGAYESRRLIMGTLAAAGNEGSTVTYNIRMWIDEDAPISEMNKTFKSRISVTIGQGIFNPYKEGTLAYDILDNYGGTTNINEIDAAEYSHRVQTYNGSCLIGNGSVYFGTEYTFDENTKEYTLSGTLTKATLEECRNGTKTCGKYTLGLGGSSATYSSGYLEEITDWDHSNGPKWVTTNTIRYVTSFNSGTQANEKGLYKIQDDLGDSYYFRGNVTNNYVQFGKFTKIANQFGNEYSTLEDCQGKREVSCYNYGDGYIEDDIGNTYNTYDSCLESTLNSCSEINKTMYWRIIRINGDGTIRMIYDGTEKVVNGKKHIASTSNPMYNNNSNDVKYTGYMYDDGTGTLINSNIKTSVDSWYNDYLKTNYEKYIADNIFCNDITIASYRYDDYNLDPTDDPSLALYTYATSAASERLRKNYNPSLKCQKQSDKYSTNTKIGNGLLVNPVGLITADEVVLAGLYNNAESNYLYSGEHIWTLTSNGWYSEYDDVTSSVFTFYNSLSSRELTSKGYAPPPGVRPVINLKTDVEFTGTGTIDSPYKIVTE